MRELVASKIGSLWIPFIVRDRNLIGEVVNVFRRTINVRNVSKMLLSITALGYCSPVYINVNNYDRNQLVNFQEYVRPYEKVLFNKPYVIVGKLRIRIELHRERIITPHICSMCGQVNSNTRNYEFIDFSKDLYSRVRFFLNIIDKPNNILELVKEMGMKTKILDILYKLKKYIVENPNIFIPEIYSILGLGYGVTPSTDDFLGGLLGTANIYLTCNGLKPLILDKNLVLKRTNWVSSYLLYYNHLGLFNNVLEGFIENIFRMKYRDSMDYLFSLLSIGHTSGLDTSLGVLAALAVILESLHGGEFIDEYFKLFFEN